MIINAIGANYTPHLSRKNTHLICKRYYLIRCLIAYEKLFCLFNNNFPNNISFACSPTGEKFHKAKEWRVFTVNCKWLADILHSK